MRQKLIKPVKDKLIYEFKTWGRFDKMYWLRQLYRSAKLAATHITKRTGQKFTEKEIRKAVFKLARNIWDEALKKMRKANGI